MSERSPMLSYFSLLFFACLYPFLAFYAHNVTESYYFSSIFTVMSGVFFLVVLAFLFAAKVWPRWPATNMATAAAFSLIVFFSFHHIESLTAHIGIYRGTIKILIWLALLGLAFLAGYRIAAKKEFLPVVVFIILGLNLSPLYTIVTSLYHQKTHQDTRLSSAPEKAESAVSGNLPNVYWLILDMYSRHDVLKQEYGFDNTPFIANLRKRGFYIADKSYSNFQSTKLSLSTTLNMNYYLPVQTEMNPLLWQEKLQGGNATVEKFRELGYKYIHIEPGGNTLKTRCGGGEDLCIHGPQNGAVSLNEAHVGLMRLTPLYRVLKNMDTQIFAFDFTTVEDISKHINPRNNTPFFVFAHILSPHPPARFNSQCAYLNRTEWELLEHGDPDADKNYINDARCLNERVLKLLDWLDENDPNAIILVQADHGRAVNENGEQLTPDMLVQKSFWHKSHAILNTYKVPEKCVKDLYQSISPINNFPFIFSCIEEKPFNPLPDRSFVIHDKADYEMFPEEIYEVERNE